VSESPVNPQSVKEKEKKDDPIFIKIGKSYFEAIDVRGFKRSIDYESRCFVYLKSKKDYIKVICDDEEFENAGQQFKLIRNSRC